jgi:hypothetical protein
MRAPRLKTLFVPIVALALLAAGCGDDDEGATDPTVEGIAGADTTRNVPADYPTIQAAVDAAEPGDLVLIDEGVYEEAVVVQTENLVIRGTDRNKVIVDGNFDEAKENGFMIFGDGVAVENLTVRNFVGNGVFWTGDYDAERILTGFRASYVTVLNNGNYGLYAFNATKGQFDHAYGSGSPDSPYYIGQCNPCDTVLSEVVGEYSQLGYSGTNSTGVTIVSSEFANNLIGVVPNSQDGEELAPNAGTTLVGNYVHDNNLVESPGNNDGFRVGRGTGIVLIGVENNIVERNLVVDNHRFGIVILPWIPEVFDRNGEGNQYDPIDNVVRGNYFRGATEGADMALALLDSSGGTMGNCFVDNDYETALPENLAEIATCDELEGSDFETIEQYLDRFGQGAEYIDYKDVPAPDLDFENMPDAATAPARPATDVPMEVDLDAIEMPALPEESTSDTTAATTATTASTAD